MTAGPPILTTPLTPEHARQLDALLATLSPEEALWISGWEGVCAPVNSSKA